MDISLEKIKSTGQQLRAAIKMYSYYREIGFEEWQWMELV
jgi:hypothetical protein